ncbi:MAG: IMP dehydrogenase [Candidatus Lokiarchaeota archaeon]|nr:IMP dehydrogenase [Candidatus Lokiarchaeota archaeon]
MGKNNFSNDTHYFRKKVDSQNGYALTFDDIICVPGFTNFDPVDIDIQTMIGPFSFKIPIFSAAMDTVTETEMAIQMALLGGLGVIHRNCPYEKQLMMVKKVKRARSFIVREVATVHPKDTDVQVKQKMDQFGVSGLVVLDDDDRVIGIVTARDLPYDQNQKYRVEEIMTKNPICSMDGISREEAQQKLYEIRKEKLPLVNDQNQLVGLITRKDLRPEFPDASKDKEGRLLCGLGISPNLPKNPFDLETFKKIDELCDIFFTDVADVYKSNDLTGIKEIMDITQTPIVLGNIGTFEAAERILTKFDFPEDKLIGLKVGMGSGSICITTIQTGIGAPTLFATAEVADAIQMYNPKIALISDGGFINSGDLTKAFAAGADVTMSGHFFAGCTESPGYIDTIGGRKVKVYRGMGSKEARSTGPYAFDRYANVKKLAEGVSDYVPFVGSVKGVLDQLCEGLKNGLVYGGARTIQEAKQIVIRKITHAGKIESSAHDLLSRK